MCLGQAELSKLIICFCVMIWELIGVPKEKAWYSLLSKWIKMERGYIFILKKTNDIEKKRRESHVQLHPYIVCLWPTPTNPCAHGRLKGCSRREVHGGGLTEKICKAVCQTCCPKGRVCTLFYLFIIYFWFFQAGFLCSFGACPGTHSLDQVGLKLKEIHLPLPS